MRFLTNNLRALVLITAALALVGCTAPRATPADDQKAKEFTPKADTASLYIYRSEMTGASAPMTVSVNNQSLGKTNARTYFQLEVAPGRYTVVSSADNTSTVTVDAEAGKSYYVWQKVTMSMGSGSARAQVSLVDEDRGRKGVLASKLLAARLRPAVSGVASTAAPAAAPAPVARAAASPATANAPAAVASPVRPAPAIATSTAAAPAMPAGQKESRLQWLKQMRDANLISAGEYETKRQQVLSAP